MEWRSEGSDICLGTKAKTVVNTKIYLIRFVRMTQLSVTMDLLIFTMEGRDYHLPWNSKSALLFQGNASLNNASRAATASC